MFQKIEDQPRVDPSARLNVVPSLICRVEGALKSKSYETNLKQFTNYRDMGY